MRIMIDEYVYFIDSGNVCGGTIIGEVMSDGSHGRITSFIIVCEKEYNNHLECNTTFFIPYFGIRYYEEELEIVSTKNKEPNLK